MAIVSISPTPTTTVLSSNSMFFILSHCGPATKRCAVTRLGLQKRKTSSTDLQRFLPPVAISPHWDANFFYFQISINYKPKSPQNRCLRTCGCPICKL